MTLDRWCGLLAAAYPEGPRRAEVLTTLAESNDGRRVPRPGDVIDVVRHGIGARLRGTARGAAYGAWADAASVAVAVGLVIHATTAVVLLALAVPPLRDLLSSGQVHRLPLRDPSEIALASVGAVAATVAAYAACTGRVLLARVMVVVAAAGGAATYALQRIHGVPLPFVSTIGWAAIGAGVLLALVVLCTGAVARAGAADVPRWWWVTNAVIGCLIVSRAPWFGHLGHGRGAVVLAAYVAQALVVAVAAMPLAPWHRIASGGALIAALPMVPFALWWGEGMDSAARPSAWRIAVVSAVLLVLLLSWAARLLRRTS